jgi:hypothetical protein
MKKHLQSNYSNLTIKRIIIIILLINFACYNAVSQSNQEGTNPADNPSYHPVMNPAAAAMHAVSRDYIPATPHAASLGIFGQIPVGNYTGTAEINIPLYNFTYKELSVPISLNYHASVVKPDNFPGTVGLGWTLQAGGCITRVVNGLVDIGPVPQGTDGHGGALATQEDFRYSSPDWSSANMLKTYVDSHILGFYPGTNPDKYVFNINGQTGSFYLYQNDTFRIQSTSGDYFYVKIHSNINSNNYGSIYLGHIFGFTMIDSKGIKYVFGDSQYIERSHPGINFMLFSTYPDLYEILSPTSWYLKSIESPNGYKIEFSYSSYSGVNKIRFMDFAVSYKNDQQPDNGVIPQARYLDNQKWNRIEGLCISEISSPLGKVIFNTSNAENQLNYPQYGTIDNYDDFIYMQTSNGTTCPKVDNGTNKPPKIDAIIIQDNNNELKRYSLIYSSNNNTRLKLTGIDEKKGNNYGKKYRFFYNNLSLPPYLSGQTDYYGFYNGKEFFNNTIKAKINSYFTQSNKESTVAELKELINGAKQSDTMLVKAEILEKIVYPTGGYTVFDYEPHYYSKKFKTWPFEVVNNANGNQITGGLRIKTVKNYDYNNILLTEKQYHYETNYLNGGSVSSGILTYTPEYVDFFQNKYLIYGTYSSQNRYNFFRVTSNPVFPLMPMNNHITYSEVTVEEPGNGFTVYKYKNFDNGYSDTEPLSYVSNIIADNTTGTSGVVEYWKQDNGISLELERGQIISKEIFDVNKNKQQQILYTYNNSPERFNTNVRFLRYESNGFNISGERSNRITAGYYYTYFPYLKEKEETIYFGMDSIIQKENYTYDEKYRLTKSIKRTDSRNQEYFTEFAYTADHDPTIDIVKKMLLKNMLAYPFQKTITMPDNKTETDFFSYKDSNYPYFHTVLYKKIKKYDNNPELLDAEIFRHDKYGNINAIYNRTDGYTCLLWGYSGQYLIAEIKNATYSQVLNKIYEPILKDITTKVEPSSSDWAIINNLRIQLPNAIITTYKYKPLIGIEIVTYPNGTKNIYEYDSLGRLLKIKDDKGMIIERYEYHYND